MLIMRLYSLCCYIIFLSCPFFCIGAEVTGKPVPAAREKRIAFFYSAHGADGWNQSLEMVLRKDFSSLPGIQMKTFKIDMNQYGSDEKFRKSIPAIDSEMGAYSPDLLITFHDNLIQDYFNLSKAERKAPVIICMDYSSEDEQYYWGLNFTGVLVMDMMPRLYGNLRHYNAGNRVAVLSCAHSPAKTEGLKKAYKELVINNITFTTYLEFAEAYRKAQAESDVVILSFSALPKGWDPATAEALIMKSTRVPTGATSCNLAPYVMIVMAPSTAEISSLIADSATKILYGAAPSMISPKSGSELVFTVNVSIAGKLGITIPVQVLKTAKVLR